MEVGQDGNELELKKVEPWNSVKVTFNIPKKAALRLKLLAEQGSPDLRRCGVLGVQIQGDSLVSTPATASDSGQREIFNSTEDASQSDSSEPPPSAGAARPPSLDQPSPGPSMEASHLTFEYPKQCLSAFHVSAANDPSLETRGVSTSVKQETPLHYNNPNLNKYPAGCLPSFHSISLSPARHMQDCKPVESFPSSMNGGVQMHPQHVYRGSAADYRTANHVPVQHTSQQQTVEHCQYLYPKMTHSQPVGQQSHEQQHFVPYSSPHLFAANNPPVHGHQQFPVHHSTQRLPQQQPFQGAPQLNQLPPQQMTNHIHQTPSGQDFALPQTAAIGNGMKVLPPYPEKGVSKPNSASRKTKKASSSPLLTTLLQSKQVDDEIEKPKKKKPRRRRNDKQTVASGSTDQCMEHVATNKSQPSVDALQFSTPNRSAISHKHVPPVPMTLSELGRSCTSVGNGVASLAQNQGGVEEGEALINPCTGLLEPRNLVSDHSPVREKESSAICFSDFGSNERIVTASHQSQSQTPGVRPPHAYHSVVSNSVPASLPVPAGQNRKKGHRIGPDAATGLSYHAGSYHSLAHMMDLDPAAKQAKLIQAMGSVQSPMDSLKFISSVSMPSVSAVGQFCSNVGTNSPSGNRLLSDGDDNSNQHSPVGQLLDASGKADQHDSGIGSLSERSDDTTPSDVGDGEFQLGLSVSEPTGGLGNSGKAGDNNVKTTTAVDCEEAHRKEPLVMTVGCMQMGSPAAALHNSKGTVRNSATEAVLSAMNQANSAAVKGLQLSGPASSAMARNHQPRMKTVGASHQVTPVQQNGPVPGVEGAPLGPSRPPTAAAMTHQPASDSKGSLQMSPLVSGYSSVQHGAPSPSPGSIQGMRPAWIKNSTAVPPHSQTSSVLNNQELRRHLSSVANSKQFPLAPGDLGHQGLHQMTSATQSPRLTHPHRSQTLSQTLRQPCTSSMATCSPQMAASAGQGMDSRPVPPNSLSPSISESPRLHHVPMPGLDATLSGLHHPVSVQVPQENMSPVSRLRLQPPASMVNQTALKSPSPVMNQEWMHALSPSANQGSVKSPLSGLNQCGVQASSMVNQGMEAPSMMNQQQLQALANQQGMQAPSMMHQQRLQAPSMVTQQRLQAPTMMHQQRVQAPSMVNQGMEAPSMMNQQQLQALSMANQHGMQAPSMVNQQRLQAPSMVTQQRLQAPTMMHQQRVQAPSMNQQGLQAPSMNQQQMQAPTMMHQQRMQAPTMMHQQRVQAPSMNQQGLQAPSMNQQQMQAQSMMNQQQMQAPSMNQQGLQAPSMNQQQMQAPTMMHQQRMQAPTMMHQQRVQAPSMNQQGLQAPSMNQQQMQAQSMMNQQQMQAPSMNQQRLQAPYMVNQQRMQAPSMVNQQRMQAPSMNQQGLQAPSMNQQGLQAPSMMHQGGKPQPSQINFVNQKVGQQSPAGIQPGMSQALTVEKQRDTSPSIMNQQHHSVPSNLMRLHSPSPAASDQLLQRPQSVPNHYGTVGSPSLTPPQGSPVVPTRHRLQSPGGLHPPNDFEMQRFSPSLPTNLWPGGVPFRPHSGPPSLARSASVSSTPPSPVACDLQRPHSRDASMAGGQRPLSVPGHDARLSAAVSHLHANLSPGLPAGSNLSLGHLSHSFPSLSPAAQASPSSSATRQDEGGAPSPSAGDAAQRPQDPWAASSWPPGMMPKGNLDQQQQQQRLMARSPACDGALSGSPGAPLPLPQPHVAAVDGQPAREGQHRSLSHAAASATAEDTSVTGPTLSASDSTSDPSNQVIDETLQGLESNLYEDQWSLLLQTDFYEEIKQMGSSSTSDCDNGSVRPEHGGVPNITSMYSKQCSQVNVNMLNHMYAAGLPQPRRLTESVQRLVKPLPTHENSSLSGHVLTGPVSYHQPNCPPPVGAGQGGVKPGPGPALPPSAPPAVRAEDPSTSMMAGGRAVMQDCGRVAQDKMGAVPNSMYHAVGRPMGPAAARLPMGMPSPAGPYGAVPRLVNPWSVAHPSPQPPGVPVTHGGAPGPSSLADFPGSQSFRGPPQENAPPYLGTVDVSVPAAAPPMGLQPAGGTTGVLGGASGTGRKRQPAKRKNNGVASQQGKRKKKNNSVASGVAANLLDDGGQHLN